MSSGELLVYKRGDTSVPNATISDTRLSWPALGLLMGILARPPQAPQGYRAFEGRGMGQLALLKAFKELDAAGYRHQITRKVAKGRVKTWTIVAEEPIPSDIAELFLEEHLHQPDRALNSAARRDLRKRAKEAKASGKAAGRAVRDQPLHGGPGHGGPEHGGPEHGPPGHGEQGHKPSVSKGLSSLRSQDPEEELPTSGEHTHEMTIPSDFRDRREVRTGTDGS